MQPLLFSVGGPPPTVEGREKLDLIEERLRAVEGFGDYLFADMTDLCLVPRPTHNANPSMNPNMGRNPPVKKSSAIFPNLNDIWRPIAFTDRQPIGSGDPWKDLLVSLPKVVQPQCDLRVSWGSTRAFG